MTIHKTTYNRLVKCVIFEIKQKFNFGQLIITNFIVNSFIVNNFVKMYYFNLVYIASIAKSYFRVEFRNKNNCIGISLPVLQGKNSRMSKIELLFVFYLSVRYRVSCKESKYSITLQLYAKSVFTISVVFRYVCNINRYNRS